MPKNEVEMPAIHQISCRTPAYPQLLWELYLEFWYVIRCESYDILEIHGRPVKYGLH
jgi:hypothetical protein